MTDIRSDAWKILSHTSERTLVVVRLSDESGGTIFLASGPVVIEGDDYLPLILRIPARSQEVDWFTRKFTVSNAVLEVLNTPFEADRRFSDLLDDKNFENRTADVRLWKPGITTWEDCLPRFSGAKVIATPESENIVLLELEDSTASDLMIDIPKIVEADATANFALPPETVGKVHTQVVGDHRALIGINSTQTTVDKDDWLPFQRKHLSRMRHLGDSEYEVSPRQVGGSAVESVMKNLGTSVWAKDTRLNRFVELDQGDWELVKNDATGCVVKRIGNTYHDYRLPSSTVTSSWTNPDNAVDGDIDTAATETLAVATATSDLNIDFAPGFEDIPQSEIDTIAVFALVDDVSNSWITDPLKAILMVDNDEAKLWTSEALNRFEAHQGTLPTLTIPSATIRFKNIDGGSHSVAIAEVYQRVTYTPEEVFPALYWGGFGDVYTAAFDLANRPNHADTAETGNSIDNVVGALEAYLRFTLGLGDDRIDLDAFDTASNLVAGQKFSYSIDRQLDTLDYLFKLVQDARCFLWWDENNTLTIKVLEDDYLSPDEVVDGRLLSNRRYGRTDERQLYTEIQVEYSGTDNIAADLSDEVTDSAAADVNGRSLAQTHLDYPSIAYADSVTADSMASHLLEAFKLSKNKIAGDLPEPYAHLGMGSILGFEDLPVNDRGQDMTSSYVIGGQTFRPFFIILKTNNTDRLVFDTTQLAKLEP